jgi:hypothetical protein
MRRDKMTNGELGRTWEAAFIAYFTILSLHLPRETEENHKRKLKMAWPIFHMTTR